VAQSIGPASRAFLLLAAVVLVLAGLKLAGPVIVPLLLAACVAAATTPIVGFLERRGLPKAIAVTLTILTVLGSIVGFGLVISVAATDFTQSLPALERELIRTKADFLYWLQAHRLGRLAPTVLSYDPSTWGARAVEAVVVGAAPLIGALGVVFFVVVFLLLEAATFREKLGYALGWRESDRIGEVRHIVNEVQRYLLIKTGLSAAVGVTCSSWCALMDLPNAILWGVLAFVLNFVPVFGSVIATIPPVLMALLYGGVSQGIAVLAGLFILHNLIGNYIEPKVMGRAAGLSALVVTVSIVVWGFIFGPVGALLSVPLTMIVKIVFANVEDTQWLAILLAPGTGREELKYIEELRRTRRTIGSPPSSRSATPSAPKASSRPMPGPAE
jgi:AI-2 transport protein TqsA